MLDMFAALHVKIKRRDVNLKKKVLWFRLLVLCPSAARPEDARGSAQVPPGSDAEFDLAHPGQRDGFVAQGESVPGARRGSKRVWGGSFQLIRGRGSFFSTGVQQPPRGSSAGLWLLQPLAQSRDIWKTLGHRRPNVTEL